MLNLSGRFIALILLISLVQLLLKFLPLPNMVLFNNIVLNSEVVAETILVSSALVAFALWIYATVPYGFRSVFGRIFMGVVLFLGFESVGELLFLISHFTSSIEVEALLHVIGGFLFVAGYLPLYASLLMLLCEQRVLTRKPIESANVFASVIFVGTLGLVWAYFVLFASRFLSGAFNFYAVLAYTLYVVFDVVALMLITPLVTADFRHGVLQVCIRELMVAVAVYAAADIFLNFSLLFGGKVWFMKTLATVMYTIAYIFLAKPSIAVARIERMTIV